MPHKSKFLFIFVALIASATALFTYFYNNPEFRRFASANTTATTVPYALYESCLPITSASCLGRLDQMAAGGFKYVINYDQLNGKIADQLAYADHANSLGMKVIWAMHDPIWWKGNAATQFSDLSSSLGGATSSIDLAQKFVSQVKNHPGTWGYYVGDETIAADHGIMKAYSDSVHAADPAHPRLFISAEDCATVGSNLKPFADVAEVIGSDFYPWPRTDCPAAQSITSIAQSVQQIANTNSKQSAYVVQAFSWAQYNESWVCTPFPSCSTFPTVSQMQQEKDLVMANMQPSIVLWYSFFDIWNTDQYNKIPAPRKTQQEYWNDVVSAAGSGPVVTPSVTQPSVTPTLTPTSIVNPTATPLPTSTPLPTPTLKPTNTPVPPSPSSVPLPKATHTPIPTATPTRIPTSTPTPVPIIDNPISMLLGNKAVGDTIDGADGHQFTATRVLLPSNRVANELSVYVGSVPASGTNITGAIYTDDNGQPGTLVWGSILINVRSPGWLHLIVPNVPLNAGQYWIGFNATRFSTGFVFSSGAPNSFTYQEWWDSSVGTWPQKAPPPSSGIQTDYQYSMTLRVQ